jgi:hypothetical protein
MKVELRLTPEADVNVDWMDSTKGHPNSAELATFGDKFFAYLRFDLSKITGNSMCLQASSILFFFFF